MLSYFTYQEPSACCSRHGTTQSNPVVSPVFTEAKRFCCMSFEYCSAPMTLLIRMWRAMMPFTESSSNLEMISTFGAFCTRLRAIRRTMPAVSPELTLGRSAFFEITSPSASISNLWKFEQRASISRLKSMYFRFMAEA